ncbi:MAG: GIY-YIG nuclease family protein [Elusimicrobia bacterium]|nr:GIY-YIG nuclease family protein [Elusimicrobiota bacterium]
MPNQKKWFVYIAECENKSLYTGATCDVKRRVKKHNCGKGGRYTRSFGPVKLLWTEKHSDKSSALKRELQIKTWPRKKKEALIQGNFSKS